MSAARKWLWIGIETIGGLSILCAVLMATAVAWWVRGMLRSSEKVNSLKPGDAREFLEWGGIERQAKVRRFLYSRISPESVTGDHDDFYVVELEHFPTHLALCNGKWISGPLTDPTLRKALHLALSWGQEHYRHFPKGIDISDCNYLFSFPWIYLDGQRVTATIVMFYEPASKRLYVVDCKI